MINKIKEIIAEELGIEVSKINDNTNLVEELDADSLAVMQIAQEIEDEFSVTIDETKLMEIKTPSDIQKAIEASK